MSDTEVEAVAKAICSVLLADEVGVVPFPDDVWPRLKQTSRDKYLRAAQVAIDMIGQA